MADYLYVLDGPSSLELMFVDYHPGSLTLTFSGPVIDGIRDADGRLTTKLGRFIDQTRQEEKSVMTCTISGSDKVLSSGHDIIGVRIPVGARLIRGEIIDRSMARRSFQGWYDPGHRRGVLVLPEA